MALVLRPCGEGPLKMTESLGEALPKMMARVRDVVIPAYESIGAPGIFAITMMKADLDKAAVALAEGDVVAMIRVYESLKSYKL